MRDFKRRLLVRKIAYSPVSAALLLILVIFLGNAVFKISKAYVATRQEYVAALKEYEDLNRRQESIQGKIDALKTERGIEEEIRNKYGFIKDGEEVIVVVDPPVSLDIETDDKKNISFIFDAFLNLFR